MDQVSEIREPQICRLCLAKTLVFFPLDNDNDASKMLEALTTMRILPTDEISTVSCLKCLLNLKLAFATQQNMLTAESKFRALISVKQECEEENEDLEEIVFEISQDDHSDSEQQNIASESEPLEKTKVFVCKICHCVKPTSKRLSQHTYDVHRTRKCPNCLQEIKTSAFRRHIVSCKPEKYEIYNNLEEKNSESSEAQKDIKVDSEVERILNICSEMEKNIKTDPDAETNPEINDSVVYTCDICGVAKTSKIYLNKHRYRVHGMKKCRSCGENIQLSQMKLHLTRCENEVKKEIEQNHIENNIIADSKPKKLKGFVCKICFCVKPTSKRLSQHKYDVHRSRKCPNCLEEVKTSAFRRHIIKCRSERNTEIDEKNAIDDNENVEIKDSEVHACNICGVTRATKIHLHKHKLRVHAFRKCPKCNENIKLSKMELHLAQCGKTVDGYFVCDICGIKKLTRVELKKHKYNVHSSEKCPICDKLITSANLSKHIERHKDREQQDLTVCEQCGKSMLRQDIRSHMRIHSTITYKCRFCEKIYKEKHKLTFHENKEHLNKEAGYTCETCGRKFYKQHSLKVHIDITHLQLRPYICEFCNVGFSSRYALKTHRRRHTNETPYKCEICGEGFRQNVSLKGHLKSKHGIEEELKFECSVCAKKLASEAALFAHSRVH